MFQLQICFTYFFTMLEVWFTAKHGLLAFASLLEESGPARLLKQ